MLTNRTSLQAWLVAAATAATGALVVASAVGPALRPLAQRTPLAADAQPTSEGVPVPAAAQRCQAQAAGGHGLVRWCLPDGVSPGTLADWYDRALPPGIDSGRLRWCVQQVQSDGTRRRLWSDGQGLVGYDLPSDLPRPRGTDPEADVLAVEVVRAPGSVCPAAARSVRGRAGAGR